MGDDCESNRNNFKISCAQIKLEIEHLKESVHNLNEKSSINQSEIVSIKQFLSQIRWILTGAFLFWMLQTFGLIDLLSVMF